jgi:hypothetical protein
MLAPVILDLPPDVSARAAQVVLDACNDAIADGVCLPRGTGGDESPRALAVARAADRRVLVVRLEVRLHPDLPGSSIVRELQFARRDPLLERWRSVGLAIATIVGEGEQRAREDEGPPVAEPPEAEPARPSEVTPAREAQPPAGRPSVAEGAPSVGPPLPAQTARSAAPAPTAQPARSAEAARTPPVAPARVAVAPAEVAAPEVAAPEVAAPEVAAPEVDAADAEGEPVMAAAPFEHRPFFVGVGVLTGTGFGAGAWRAGSTLRAGWHGIDGWQLATSLAVAWRTSEETFTASWMSLQAGVGYRLALSDAVSVGTLVFGGVERARFEVLAAGVSHSEASYSPRFGLGVDGRWRASEGLGIWVAADGSSAGRESRLFVAPEIDSIRSYPIDVALFLGVAWWPD